MSRKYSLDLLEKIQEKQETINVQGAEVIVKKIYQIAMKRSNASTSL